VEAGLVVGSLNSAGRPETSKETFLGWPSAANRLLAYPQVREY
jgi:hypothetical protein